MPESGSADIEPRLARLEQQDRQLERLATLLGRQEPPKRTRHWDAYVAVIATLIGLLALVVSGYTAYVQRQQLRAQVWPHVVISTGNVAPEIGWHAVNSGTGPARVTAVRVIVDNKPVPSWAHAAKVMGPDSGGVVTAQLSGSVLPAGTRVNVLAPLDEEATARFKELYLSNNHPIVMTVCYCSVLDECWVVSSETLPEPIADANACPISPADRFKQ